MQVSDRGLVSGIYNELTGHIVKWDSHLENWKFLNEVKPSA